MDQAIENWDRLDKKLQLTDSFYGAIESLKVTRNSQAHPLAKIENLPVCLTKLNGYSNENIEIVDKFVSVLKIFGVPDIETSLMQ